MVEQTTQLEVPASLLHQDLSVVWLAARRQLDRHGNARRGSVGMPLLSDAARFHLSALLGIKLTARLDLAQLEQSLLVQGVGADLDDALVLLGAPRSPEREAERAVASRRLATRQRVELQVNTWAEPWAHQWVSWLFQSGQMVNEDPNTADVLARTVRVLLDQRQAANGEMLARNDLAVTVCGSAHALDDGVLLERCTRRALWHELDEMPAYRDGRQIWNIAGILTDRVSAPVLCWKLPLHSQSALGQIAIAADAACVPIHLSLMALTQHPVQCENKGPVLLVENPRLVEAAAERQLNRCVIATNGNPSTAVMKLVLALLGEGVEVRHHADFDTAGVGICRRLVEHGCRPWQMGAQDYDWIIDVAIKQGLELPVDDSLCGATPWDPQLQVRMNQVCLAVHEELLLDELLRVDGW